MRAPLQATSARLGEERKIVTVLFADLVGFTARAERLDPEDVRGVLSPYHARVRAELERCGGTVEKFIGDAVMAVFGAPVAHEDDPERAVRAALAIRDWIAEQARAAGADRGQHGRGARHVGARPAEGEGMVAGDVVNTAARLQAAAPVNGVLVGETTYRATRDAIDYRDGRSRSRRRARPSPSRSGRPSRRRLGIGVDVAEHAQGAARRPRARARASALDRSGACARSARLQLVTLVGVPGIGKRRLVGELFREVEADRS